MDHQNAGNQNAVVDKEESLIINFTDYKMYDDHEKGNNMMLMRWIVKDYADLIFFSLKSYSFKKSLYKLLL